MKINPRSQTAEGLKTILYCLSLSLCRNYRDSVLNTLLELNDTIGEGEKGVILATTNIGTRMNVSTTLTNNDLTSLNSLTTKNLGTKTLCVGVATVTG